jgi:hypothetical protein
VQGPVKVAPGPSDVAVCVLSCDPYSDLWQPFFTLFWRYWPDCPFPVYLTSNTLSYPDPRVQTLAVGRDLRDWSGALLSALNRIDSSYVLLILEDFFLRDLVPTGALLESIRVFQAGRGRMLRLIPQPGPDAPASGSATFGAIRPGSPYRVSAQASVWRKDELQWLVRPGESIWDFELKGSKRSGEHTDGYFAVSAPLLPYGHHVVDRGKWFPWAARRYGRMGIGCDFERRPVMSTAETLKWTVRKAFSYRTGLLRLLRS